ncbi:MAG: hypothetical protein F6K17_14920 [Okeania sp. SIO3C4]|nr:hypothetical protein [Okeania sp. SIO3C4]
MKPYTKQGWTFTKGPNLRGSFDVGSYYACGTKKRCGLNPIQSGTGGVGAVLKLNYRPAQKGKKADPKPQNNLLYWIQRVITNNPIPENRPRKQQTYIDNRIEIKKGQWQNAIHPYYTYRAQKLKNNGYFGDRPYRKENSSLKSNFYWMAELYLAEADPVFPQQVTIYNGVRWGWRYQYYSADQLRKKNPLVCPIVKNKGKTTKVSYNTEQQLWASLVKTGALSKSLINTICKKEPPKTPITTTYIYCSGGSGGGGCRSRRSSATDYIENHDQDYAEILNKMESQEYLDSSDRPNTSNTSPETIPEPTSAFALLMLGVGAIANKLKNRNNKPK